MDLLFAGLIGGFLISLIVWLSFRRRGGGRRGPELNFGNSVDAIRSVGELVVLKVYTTQIVTSRDHMFGDWGERWLNWLFSSKKAAILFEFVLDFRYDLRSPLFRAEPTMNGGVAVRPTPATGPRDRPGPPATPCRRRGRSCDGDGAGPTPSTWPISANRR